jgi:hypothetical protein
MCPEGRQKKLRPVCRNKPPPTEKLGREKGSPNIYGLIQVFQMPPVLSSNVFSMPHSAECP